MSVPRRESDPRRKATDRSEDYFKRLMEETPGGRVTSADMAHISNTANRNSGKVSLGDLRIVGEESFSKGPDIQSPRFEKWAFRKETQAYKDNVVKQNRAKLDAAQEQVRRQKGK